VVVLHPNWQLREGKGYTYGISSSFSGSRNKVRLRLQVVSDLT
jgi:hypothetical protein